MPAVNTDKPMNTQPTETQEHRKITEHLKNEAPRYQNRQVGTLSGHSSDRPSVGCLQPAPRQQSSPFEKGIKAMTLTAETAQGAESPGGEGETTGCFLTEADIRWLAGFYTPEGSTDTSINTLQDLQRLINCSDVNKTDHQCKTALIYAIDQGFSTAVVAFLLAQNIDITCQDKKGRNALHLAILKTLAYRNVPSVKLLVQASVKAGADLDQNDHGLLFIAVRYGHTEIVRLLLDNGATPGRNVQLRAVMSGDTEIVRLLLEYKVIPNGDLLVAAVRNGHTEIVSLLFEHGVTVDGPTFYRLAEMGYEKLPAQLRNPELLHKLNVDINYENMDSYYTTNSLHRAVESGDIPMVDYLIKVGASTDKTTFCGDTPLSLAAFSNNSVIVNLLINAGVAIDGKAFYYMIKNGFGNFPEKLRAPEVLRQLEIDLDNDTYCDGRSPLQNAAYSGDFRLVKLLIDAGAKINEKTSCSLTPLTLAMLQGHTDIVRLLLEYKIIPDDDLPLTAVELGHTEIVRLLLEYKAIINEANPNKVIPNGDRLVAAVKNGQTEIVNSLLKDGATVDGPTFYRLAKMGYENLPEQLRTPEARSRLKIAQYPQQSE